MRPWSTTAILTAAIIGLAPGSTHPEVSLRFLDPPPGSTIHPTAVIKTYFSSSLQSTKFNICVYMDDMIIVNRIFSRPMLNMPADQVCAPVFQLACMCTHAYAHACVCPSSLLLRFTCVYLCMRAYVRPCVHMHLRMHILALARLPAHPHAHAHAHAYARIGAHTRRYAHTCTRTHICIHARAKMRVRARTST